MSELVRDSLVVYGHAVGSDQIRTDLPAINHSWSGFDGPDALLADVDDPATFASLGNEVMFPAQAAQLTALLDEPLASSDPHRSVGAGSRDEAAGGDASGDGRPPLYVAHVLAPHMPYVATPDGDTYPRREVTGMATVDARLAWPEGGPERHRIEAYQRLLLQVGAVDRLLGAVIDELEATGIWDDAIVVVTADHGASFEDGWFRSARAGGAEVTSVPLFIKAPHQAKGQVRDESALTIDAVPTLLGIAGVESPSTFDGLDLNHDQIPSTRDGAYLDDETRTPDQRLDALAAVVQRRTRWVEPDGGWGAVARAGSGGHFVGMPVGQLEVAAGTGGTWSTPVPTEGRTSRAVTVVRIAPPAVAVAPVTVLLACDGTVAGAGHNPQATGDAYEAFVFTDPDRCTNTSAMSLYVVQPDGTIRPMERVR